MLKIASYAQFQDDGWQASQVLHKTGQSANLSDFVAFAGRALATGLVSFNARYLLIPTHFHLLESPQKIFLNRKPQHFVKIITLVDPPACVVGLVFAESPGVVLKRNVVQMLIARGGSNVPPVVGLCLS